MVLFCTSPSGNWVVNVVLLTVGGGTLIPVAVLTEFPFGGDP